jgi:hypothetical protein
VVQHCEGRCSLWDGMMMMKITSSFSVDDDDDDDLKV